MRLKKTLPLDKVLNRLIAMSVSHGKTADNIHRTRNTFSSLDVATRIEREYLVRANELELFALTVMKFQHGDSNSIFNYHVTLEGDEENTLHAQLLERIQKDG